MHYRVAFAIGVAVSVFCATTTSAEMKVTVESKEVLAGTSDVTVGVYLENNQDLWSVVIPLEFREIDPGSFIDMSLMMTRQGRLAGGDYWHFIRRHRTPSESNTCSGPVSSTWVDTNYFDFVSPDAIKFTVTLDGVPHPPIWIGSDGLPPDGTPSVLLTFDVTSVPGSFEIDTCCAPPDGHLIFNTYFGDQIVPSFTKGIVTITEGPLRHCNERPADVNCDGVVNILDAVTVVNVGFRGAPEPSRCCY